MQVTSPGARTPREPSEDTFATDFYSENSLVFGYFLTGLERCQDNRSPGHGFVKDNQGEREVLDHGGDATPGFTANDCPPGHPDQTGAIVHWNGDESLDRLAGKPIFPRCRLNKARLYSFRID